MESEILYLGTIHNPEGKRIGLEISTDLEHIKDRMANTPKTFGSDHTTKIWICREMKQ